MKRAFTMAEILLSLTIIGVVAAITLPSLTGNINERTWNTQRKALYARMSQAISLMPALNGYGELKGASSEGASDAVDTAAETFVTNGLSKVLKINNICDYQHLTDCGVASKITALYGSIFTTPQTMSELNYKMIDGGAKNTNATAFETQNGESIITFYNKDCISWDGSGMNTVSNFKYVQPSICVNFIFDLNGSKGPNTVGKDIGFMTVINPIDSIVVAPDVPVKKITEKVTQPEAIKLCKTLDSNYRIPNLDELSSIFVNDLLLNGTIASSEESGGYWSATKYSATEAWLQGFKVGGRNITPITNTYNVQCVKR